MLFLTAAMIFAGLACSRAETRLAQADKPAAAPPALKQTSGGGDRRVRFGTLKAASADMRGVESAVGRVRWACFYKRGGRSKNKRANKKIDSLIRVRRLL